MNKKFLSAVLFGALMVTSTGTFVSCKDYDDDIDQLRSEVVANKEAIKKLQDLMGEGKFITGVSKTEAGLVFTMSNGGASITIPTAEGKDGTVVTISEDGYWVLDGKKTTVKAKGEKGDTGAAGEAGAPGKDAKSPKISSTTGNWEIWDVEKGQYVDSGESAIGAQTYVVVYENYYELNVMEQDADGKNLGFKSIKLPISGTLLNVIPELNGQAYGQDFDLYYGILNSDVAWTGHKAVNGKMLAGMYPTADRDIKMQLNPSDVDANDYSWSFVSTDNSTPWGLNFAAPQVWTGKATTSTRAITSASGLWNLPRDVQKWDLNAAEVQGRPDYVHQFKANDGNKYMFALRGTSKVDGKSVNSPYVYTFVANNVNSVKDIWTSGLTMNPSGKTFVYGKEYAPKFDLFYSENDYEKYAEDSVLIYDYYLEIDKSEITDESIRKYGLNITADGYRFIAKNAAVVNNTVWFKYNYILINGKTGSFNFGVNFNDEETTVTNKYIGDFTAPFNATVSNEAHIYNLSNSFDLTDFFTTLGAAGKLKWIDALARNIQGAGAVTDPNEIRSTIFNKKEGSTDTDYTVELLGGDPINNQATWNTAAYNATLLRQYVDFDYVDAEGNTCLTGTIRDLDKIAALKVTFKVNSNLGRVSAPYYTIDGKKYANQGVALPLDNSFRVEIATRYDQYEISKANFTFELTMPTNCPIKRQSVGNQTTAWSVDENGADVLKVYGEKQSREAMAADLRDAFIGVYNFQNGAYNDDSNIEGRWYDLQVPTNSFMLIGQSNTAIVNLAQISPSSVYTNWNTRGFFLNGHLDEYTLTNIKYHHFNVYTEKQDDIVLKFASKVADSKQASCNGTKANPLVANAVYNADKTLNHYEFSVANSNFTMKDAFNNAYYLFDSSSKFRANMHVKLLEDRQGIAIEKNAPSYYGLYPSARVDGQATNLVTFALDKTGATDKTTKMTMTIDKSSGVDKVFEITYNVTDVFGCVKPVTFYVRTVNEAIGNDDKE